MTEIRDKMQFGLKPKDLDLIKTTISSYGAVTSAKIFGSRAVGNFRPNSDIDIALFGSVDHSLLARIKSHLEELPLPYTFDVAAYNNIKHAPFKEHIDKFGVTLQ